MVELMKALVLGIIQGFTEFLPISSTGHLLIFRKLFGLSEAGLFLDTMLHLGTLISVFIIFWDDILQLLKKPFSKLALLIIVGTIPTAIIGLTFEDYFEGISKTGVTVGWEFLFTGFILWLAESIKGKGYKNVDQIQYKDAFLVGTLQGAAILPAISRSGLTIAGALFRGIDKGTAARFSFLMSIPAILGAVVLQSLKLLKGEELASLHAIGTIPLIVATLASAISGFIAVKWMLAIIQRGSLKVFSIYVWILGIGILISQFLGKW
ncbi:undecaprenyl-diphosphate phosphatase [Tepidibacillus fermentans]|uniref:Undecaprenyl-diphosphatase n=1 Tax=Tepidibacillus fermentans TaxID=1281767 RepID=A0A4R3K5Y2_9BACI|nr:undecaprenyl-diphosphate phosphatase [Tepidibacillus fermentans]TCS78137.1 undecaprenyl-diphosphatase [Tepidibacillus fermentans]